MTTKPLLWYPPAPAQAPRGFAHFPPDDWALQPKLDGIRVIWWRGEPWTRHGKILSEAKGAGALRAILRGVSDTLDGEWIARLPGYYLFDLPDHDGTLDERLAAIDQLPAVRDVWPIHTDHGYFEAAYRRYRDMRLEGIVLKRRASIYEKMHRPDAPTGNWRKRRFCWD